LPQSKIGSWVPGPPVLVLVANPESVYIGDSQLRARVGSFLRTMTRVPSCYPDKSSRAVSSATQAPSRIRRAFKLIESAQSRWRAVNAPLLVALVRAGVVFKKGKLVETTPTNEEVISKSRETPIHGSDKSNHGHAGPSDIIVAGHRCDVPVASVWDVVADIVAD